MSFAKHPLGHPQPGVSGIYYWTETDKGNKKKAIPESLALLNGVERRDGEIVY